MVAAVGLTGVVPIALLGGAAMIGVIAPRRHAAYQWCSAGVGLHLAAYLPLCGSRRADGGVSVAGLALVTCERCRTMVRRLGVTMRHVLAVVAMVAGALLWGMLPELLGLAREWVDLPGLLYRAAEVMR